MHFQNDIDNFASHFRFNGTHKPQWEPDLTDTPDFSNLIIRKHSFSLRDSWQDVEDFFYIADNFLDLNDCWQLIEQFIKTEPHPVGINGYITDPDNVGSYRTNAWSPC